MLGIDAEPPEPGTAVFFMELNDETPSTLRGAMIGSRGKKGYRVEEGKKKDGEKGVKRGRSTKSACAVPGVSRWQQQQQQQQQPQQQQQQQQQQHQQPGASDERPTAAAAAATAATGSASSN
ncbi:hypothetical protein HZH68_002438 [Vespula germanica]|uniref:Uncharacterized protein n=1 Tax=Vespula germanica TaxID=30212 RepID=A0A834NMA7_VESGE|nr:hypothetical protein HZH68_002438 [Vespula germanica]